MGRREGSCLRQQCFRQRPYCDECTRSHPNSEVKHHKARSVLGWGTAWEALRVPLTFHFACCKMQLSRTTLIKTRELSRARAKMKLSRTTRAKIKLSRTTSCRERRGPTSRSPSESQTSECSDLLSRSRATFVIVAQRQPGKLLFTVLDSGGF